MSEDFCIVLATASHPRRKWAAHVATLAGGHISEHDAPDQLRLVVTDTETTLHAPQEMSLGGVKVDWSGIDVRPGSGHISRKQPLGRAIGAKARTVIDATAGMGQDAFLLACMGYEVVAVERSAIIWALLCDGLARANADAQISCALAGRMQIELGDARDVLQSAISPPDVVYLDPMFPPKRRASALPKKEIQLLRLVVGDDADAEQLLAVARQVARQRVVVKRPTHAPPLEQPTMSIESKLLRYDVYVTNA